MNILFFIVTYIVFVIIFLLFLRVVFKNYLQKNNKYLQLFNKGLKVKGSSIFYKEEKIDGQSIFFPIIEFFTYDKQAYQIECNIGYYNKKNRIFKILYNPKNPNENIVFSIPELIISILFWTLIVCAFLLLSYEIYNLIFKGKAPNFNYNDGIF